MQDKSTIEIFNNLVGEYDQVKDILDVLKQKKAQLESYNILRWDEANKFQSNLNNFEKNFLDYYTSDEFFNLFEQAKESQLAIIVLTSLMNKFVDTFDKSIKTLKSSTKYKYDENKVKDFKIIIGKYLALFERWTKIIPEGSIQYHEDFPLNKYMDNIIKIFNEMTSLDSQQLNPSSSFSVNAAVLGATTDFYMNFPKTFEDTFMLIHQNLLVISGCILNYYCNISIINSTKLFKDIQKQLSKVSYKDKAIKLTSIFVLEDKIAFHYNLPLRNHSVSFDLFMNSDKTSSIKFNFLGHGGRWEQILAIAFFFSILDQTSIKVISLKYNELIFITTYKIKCTYDLTKKIQFLINATLESSGFLKGFEEIYKSSINKEEMFNLIYNWLITYRKNKINNWDLLLAAATGIIYFKFDKGINFAIKIAKLIFASNYNELKKKALGDNSLIFELFMYSNKNEMKVVTDILKQVFEGNNKGLKKEVLAPFGLAYGMISYEGSFMVDIVRDIFLGSDNELKKEALCDGGVVFALKFSDKKEYNILFKSIVMTIWNDGPEDLKKLAKGLGYRNWFQ